MQVEFPQKYVLPSGRRLTVLKVDSGYVTYTLEGVRSMFPFRKQAGEFLAMVDVQLESETVEDLSIKNNALSNAG